MSQTWSQHSPGVGPVLLVSAATGDEAVTLDRITPGRSIIVRRTDSSTVYRVTVAPPTGLPMDGTVDATKTVGPDSERTFYRSDAGFESIGADASVLAPAAAAPVASAATSGTLTAGAEHNLSPASAAAWTLPTGVSASAWPTTVKNNGTATLTIARGGSDTINGGTTSVTLAAGEWARFVSNGAGAWTQSGTAGQSGTYASLTKSAKVGGGIVYLGDSVTANGASIVNGITTYTSAGGPTAWAQTLSGHLFKQVNSGVASNTTSQMIARFATDVAAYSPAVVHIEGGTNDAVTSVSAATIIANLTTLIQSSQALGAKVLVSGIPPRNALTSGQRTIRNTVNRWLADNSRVLGFTYINVDQILTDPASATQQWLTDYTADGTHPTSIAAYKWGKLIAARLVALAPSTDAHLPGFPYDPNLLTLNSQQIGTGGSLGSGITGSLAASWSNSPLNGTVTAVASKVARTDGLQGEWQQVQITAQSGNNVGVRQQIQATSGFTAGTDSVYAFAEYQLDATDLSSIYDVSLNLSGVTSGFSVVQTVQALNNAGGGLSTLSQFQALAVAEKGASGILVTPAMLVDPTAATCNLELRFLGLGTIRWGRAGVMKV